MTSAARRLADQYYSPADETLKRRLEEGRAFWDASDGLSTTRPEFSARSGATVVQRLVGWIFVAGLVTGLFLYTAPTLVWAEIALGAIFGLIVLLRITAALWSQLPRSKSASLPARDLPTIAYLVPLKDEERVVGQLIHAISQLDYPRHKLHVKLLIEADDDRTMAAAIAADRPYWFEIIPVPPGHPRTKPKALNYGRSFTQADVIAVLDAEDLPSPGQARAAAAAFHSGGRDLAVVQAPLVIDNGADGWLARQFEVEYAIHFGLWLPFMARIGAPLPLGGTSNYFSRKWLDSAGGWDAWNVTEDADIGLRLARMGGRSAMIAPPTREEAPARLQPWFRQRRRWMKGHLQTWLTLMRQPFKAARGMGLARFAITQLTFGGALLASIMHVPLYAFIAYSVATLSLETWHAVLLGTGYASVVAAAFFARARHASFWTLATLPLYWALLSFAMLRALIDIKSDPHGWAKTPHGLSASRTKQAATASQRADNVIQLELPFNEPGRSDRTSRP